MDLKQLLEKLKKLLEKEYKLLIRGVVEEKGAEEILKIEEEKVELLSRLSQFKKEEFQNFVDDVKEIEKLNDQVGKLLLNNLNFIESIFEELFPEKDTTYGKQNKNFLSILNKKV